MKNVFNLFAGIIVMFAVMATGCSDDEADYFVPDVVENFEFSTSLKGRVFIVDPWEGNIVIPFSKEITNPGFQFPDNHLNWEVKKGIEKNYLLLSLKKDSPKRAFLFRIKASGIFANAGRSAESDAHIYLVCRSLGATGSTEMPTYLRTIGQSVSLVGEILSAPLANVLDIDKLYNDTCIVEKATMSQSSGYEITGSRYKETVSKLSESMSLSATFPVKGAMVSAGFSQAYSEEEISSNKYEYHIDVYNKTFAEAHLAPEFSILGANAYLPYITTNANQVLNQPDSELYKAFSNDDEGIKKLYDTYGTHVMTGGVFGGTFIYVFGRKQTASFRSTSNAAGASLSLKFPSTGENDLNWLQTYFRVMATKGGTLSAEGSDYNSEEEEVTKAKSFFVIRGGNGDPDFEKWSASLQDVNDNLELVSYGPGDGTSYMIPLYELVKDEARRKAMETYWVKYFESYEKEMAEIPLVVADFMMQTVGSEDDIPEKKIIEGPANGKKLIYYPLLLNENFGNVGDRGKAVNTANDNFLAVAQDKAQVWWYALEYADECNPISAVAFLDEDDVKSSYEGKTYSLRGERADEGMNWPAIDNHYVALSFEKYNSAHNTDSTYVTGVGLMYDDKIIATSAGTDMIPPYSDKEQFNRYWGEGSPYTVGFWHMKAEDTSWFGKNKAAGHKNWIFPVFTKIPLVAPVSATPPKAY